MCDNNIGTTIGDGNTYTSKGKLPPLLVHPRLKPRLDPGRHPFHSNGRMTATPDPLILGPQLKSQVCRPDNDSNVKGTLPENRLWVVPVAVLELLLHSIGGNVQGAYPLDALVRHTFWEPCGRIHEHDNMDLESVFFPAGLQLELELFCESGWRNG